MPARRLLPFLLVLAIAPAAPAGAASPPVVSDLQAVAGEEAVEVSGRVSFEGAGAEVAEDPEGDAAVADIGTDLTGASITPAGEDELRFAIDIADPIDDLAGVPEIIHYNWTVNVVTGEETAAFGLQALRTSTLQDLRDGRIPAGEPVIRLLTCSTNATGGQSCSQATRLDGGFTEEGLEIMVPMAAIGARDGSLISPGPNPINASAGVSGGAWYQNGTAGDAMPIEASYAVGGVKVGIVEEGQPPTAAAFVDAELGPEGAFLEALPLPPVRGSYLAVARACEALTCAVASTPFEVLTDAPTPDPFDPVLTEQRVFFHCAGDTPVANLNLLTDGPATWDATPPAGSLTGGQGCAAADPPARNTSTQESPLDAVFTGTAEGNLDSMTVRAYGRFVDGRGDQETFTILARVTIDGTVVLPPSAGSTLVVTPQVGANGIALVEFTITNLQSLRAEDHGRSHEVTFSLDPWHIEHDAVWLWDAEEVPAGITFNPESPAGPVLRAPDQGGAESPAGGQRKENG